MAVATTASHSILLTLVVCAGLLVPSDASATPGLRLRSHVEGGLTAPRWSGPEVPASIPRAIGTLELFVLDDAPEGRFALYREPYGRNSCELGSWANCAYRMRLYATDGTMLFDVDPAAHFSRRDHLEIADVHYIDRTVYFNEACQSYSLEAQGRCSSLVALDPFADAVRWRTPPLISRDVFLVVGEYIVAGYGFTAEADALHLIRRSDGAVVADLSIGIAHDDLTLKPDGTISVLLHDGRERTVRIVTSGRTASLAFVRRSRR